MLIYKKIISLLKKNAHFSIYTQLPVPKNNTLALSQEEWKGCYCEGHKLYN